MDRTKRIAVSYPSPSAGLKYTYRAHNDKAGRDIDTFAHTEIGKKRAENLLKEKAEIFGKDSVEMWIYEA